MKCIITILILILLVGICVGQLIHEVVLIPGNGIVIDIDTIRINSENPKSLLAKIDSTKFETSISYSSGLASGFIFHTDSISRKTTTKEASWSTTHCNIKLDSTIIFRFEGTSRADLNLKNIQIYYPFTAITIDGIKTGDSYKKIFEYYEQTEGSYGYGGFGYCYNDKGIKFFVKSYEEEPNSEMYEKIMGFVLYPNPKLINSKKEASYTIDWDD